MMVMNYVKEFKTTSTTTIRKSILPLGKHPKSCIMNLSKKLPNVYFDNQNLNLAYYPFGPKNGEYYSWLLFLLLLFRI